MSSDAWDAINRRAAAVAGIPYEEGFVSKCNFVAIEGDCTYTIGYRRGATVDGGGYHEWADPSLVPQMRSPATRGILRAALCVSVVVYPTDDDTFVCFVGDYCARTGGIQHYAEARGDTHEQAEAAALVALAEARGQWGPR